MLNVGRVCVCVFQDVRVSGRLRRAHRGARQSAPARDEPLPQVLPVAGHPPAQGPADQAQRAVPHRVRVLAGVPHHPGARHPAAAQEGQSPGAKQDARQDDHGGGRQNGRRGRGRGAQAAAGQGTVAQQGVFVEEPVQ